MKAAALVACLALAISGCDRETRTFARPVAGPASPAVATPSGELRPGGPGDGLGETVSVRNFNGDNAYELSQGKRLFRWYNCSGCHSNGGGGMGPALMDEKWLYGHEPDQVFATIMEGRPNGMPAFRGRIPEDQAWQLVAYVRAMSGQAPKSARSARSDSLPGATKGESRQPRLSPVPDAEKAR